MTDDNNLDPYPDDLPSQTDFLDEDLPQILIIVHPNGFETHVDNRLAPPTVAGAAWLLEQMAQMSLMTNLAQQAQQAQQQQAPKIQRIATLDHLKKRGN